MRDFTAETISALSINFTCVLKSSIERIVSLRERCVAPGPSIGVSESRKIWIDDIDVYCGVILKV